MFATRPVDAPVDARERRRDLVDGAVQVVDPALERDRELDEVLAAAADQHALRVAEPADPHPRDPREREPGDPDHARDDCDDGATFAGDVHAGLAAARR